MVLRLLFIAFLLLLGCGELQFDDPADPRNISHPRHIAYQSFKDQRDGQTYNSVVIGNQTWMAENLNYNASGSFCVENIKRDGEIRDTLVSNGGYCDIYGRLYDWETAKNACPNDWHLPNDAEWKTLNDFVGNSANKLKSTRGWMNYYSDNGNGTDDYGFTAIPGGSSRSDIFRGIGDEGGWWSSTDDSDYNNYAYCWGMENNSNYISNGINCHKYKSGLFSVRCVKDDDELCGGKKYDPANQRCTDNVVETKGGAGWINAGTQFCSNNTVYDLCGGKTYEPANQRCGTGNVVETMCGSGWFDATNDNLKCENGVLKTKCGNSWYSSAEWNPKTQYCSNGTTIKSYGKLTDDRDSKDYKTVEIGNQTWMAENLNYVANNSVCYETNEANCTIYGRLYNWTTAKTACPDGWHLPSNAEWTALTTFVGTDSGKKLMANSNLWQTNIGTDNYGFSALPGGKRYSSGLFDAVGVGGYWWTATWNINGLANRAFARSIYDNASESYGDTDDLLSVRCVKDSE